MLNQVTVNRKINRLEKQIDDYTLKIEEAKKEHQLLLQDKEKYARERYFLHKKGEQVFIMNNDKVIEE